MSTANPTSIPTATQTAAPRRLYRSTRDSKISGLCGGIAEANGWDVTAVRVIVATSAVAMGWPIVAYLIAWALTPTDATVFGWYAPQPHPAPVTDDAQPQVPTL